MFLFIILVSESLFLQNITIKRKKLIIIQYKSIQKFLMWGGVVIGNFMPTDYSLFYKTLAEGMDDMLASINSNLDAIVKSIELLDYLLDLTTAENFDVNQSLLDIRPAMTNVHQSLIVLPRDEMRVYVGVESVNDHTKRYIDSDLTNFVNNEVWFGSCVPFEWARVSEITGEDISGWNVCDPS